MPGLKFLLPPLAVMCLAAWSWTPFGSEESETSSVPTDFGNVAAGRKAFGDFGCGTCHRIRGRDTARGLVGPPLDSMGQRVYIAGALRNTPANMVKFLREPEAVEPGTVMPDLGLSEEQARNITAYLYTLD